MNIILDAMGGDLAPLESLRGAAQAIREQNITVTLVGDEAAIRKAAAEHSVSLENIVIVDAPRVIPMDADPTLVLKEYGDSSMATGMKLLADGKGDAFVSAGSTGALLVGATFLVKRSKGVKRPAIATMMPLGNNRYYLLMDAGANHDCRAAMLEQFAVMGSVYYEKIYSLPSPRVGLVNIGSEEHKGDDLRRESYALLKKNEHIRFIGNIEARDLPLGGCDVAICDGFTGNIILKLSEGFAKYFGITLKEMFLASIGTKIGALLLKNKLAEFKRSVDYKETGGAPLLGIRKPVLKAHGSSDARAFKNAIRQAVFCCERQVVETIEAGLAAQQKEEQ